MCWGYTTSQRQLRFGGTLDVVYASALWYASTKVNCHHLAERLSEKTPVLFVESVGARRPRAHEWRRIFPRLLRTLRPLRKVRKNLWVFSPLPLPLYTGRGIEKNSSWVGLQVGILTRLLGWGIEALWVFHPMGLGTARRLKSRACVYYCVDDYSANPGVDPAAVLAMEQQVGDFADAIIVTGVPLVAKFSRHPDKVSVLPNVADRKLFLTPNRGSHPILERIKGLPRPRVGYVGNLAAYKIDMKLVAQLAAARPDWTIVLVGPTNQGDVDRVIGGATMPTNVHFVGEVPHEAVPAVVKAFDVAILPSAQHDVMLASFPLKFFEYLLTGVPVVAKPIPALQPFLEAFDSATSSQEFVAAIQRRLEHDPPEEAARRQAFACRFNWDDRMDVLWELRSGLIGRAPRSGSAIVVAGVTPT